MNASAVPTASARNESGRKWQEVMSLPFRTKFLGLDRKEMEHWLMSIHHDIHW